MLPLLSLPIASKKPTTRQATQEELRLELLEGQAELQKDYDEYEKMKEKQRNGVELTEAEKQKLKVWVRLAKELERLD